MDPRTGLDGFGISRPHRYSIPGPSSPKRVATGWTNELSRPATVVMLAVSKITIAALSMFSAMMWLYLGDSQANVMDN